MVLALHLARMTLLAQEGGYTAMQQRRYRVTGAGARQRLLPLLKANLQGFDEDSEDPKVFCIARAALRASQELL
jgi:hypothetical protein